MSYEFDVNELATLLNLISTINVSLADPDYLAKGQIFSSILNKAKSQIMKLQSEAIKKAEDEQKAAEKKIADGAPPLAPVEPPQPPDENTEQQPAGENKKDVAHKKK